MATKTIIHQIYFNEQTKEFINPIAFGYDNSWFEGKPIQPCFENHIISELLSNDHKNADYFSVLSWQFESKNPYRLENFNDDMKRFPKYDCYTFYKLHTQPNVWRVAENWHKGIIETAQHIFNRFKSSINISRINTPTIYQNAHITKINIYEDYVNTWLNPLMEIMEDKNDIWLQNRLYQDTKYKSGRFSPEILEKLTGVPYYPMHTFICERFFSTYMAINKHSIKHLC
jgi:hypothetical protein